MTAVVAGQKADFASRTAVRSVLFPFLTTTLAVIIIWSVFNAGVRRGMDHTVAWGPESELNGMAIAISEMRHGLSGYVGYGLMVDAMNKVVKRGIDGPTDPKFLDNLKNGELLNEAIAAALALGPQPASFVSQRSLMTMVYDDIGIVDYDKIAFSLFGFRVEALYYLYFAVLSLSSAVFLLQFWQRPIAQVLLLCNLFAFYLELNALVFTHHVPTFWGMRHGSTLAILPMYHLALLMILRVRLSWSAAIFALVQIVIVVLATRIRGSAVWTVFLLAGLAVFFAIEGWRQSPRGERSFMGVVKAGAKWPFVFVIVALLSSKFYTDAKLHPAYFTDDIMPHHGAWHSAYLGIYASPTLFRQTGVPPESWSDRMGYDVALAYLRKRGFISSEAEYISPWTATFKMRLHDNVMRSVYLDLVKENPLSTAGLYLFWKPRSIVYTCALALQKIPLAIWLGSMLAAAAIAAATVIDRRTGIADIRSAILLGFVAVLFSALPNLWAYASIHTSVDLVVCILIFVLLGAWALGSELIERLRRRMTGLKRGATA